ncbi:MAG: S41 family peptidase [Myxococcota bacterium]|nr:S41 family peptidase [Myxococcota bacterium]
MYSKDGHTIPQSDISALEGLLKQNSTTSTKEVGDYLGAAVVIWNVFRHFYPYFNVVKTNWEEVLTDTFERALQEKDGDLLKTLDWLVAQAYDGHGVVVPANRENMAYLPVRFDWIEEQVVVTRSLDTKLSPGDVIHQIDGREATEVVAESMIYVSGSPHRKRTTAQYIFGEGQKGSTVSLVVEHNGTQQTVELSYTEDRPPHEREGDSIRLLEEGVYYIDLTRASMPEIKANIDDIATAPGVIFDLRGYPNGNHNVISHLLDGPDTSGEWMSTPLIIYPDMEKLAGWSHDGWLLPAVEPHVQGKVVFLNGGMRAMSYTESFMSFIEHYQLADEIVGEPTNGTNGNVVSVSLPGELELFLTGMRVRKHDGTQLHLIGIEPTVPVRRTRAGIAAGRDEILEKAYELVK